MSSLLGSMPIRRRKHGAGVLVGAAATLVCLPKLEATPPGQAWISLQTPETHLPAFGGLLGSGEGRTQRFSDASCTQVTFFGLAITAGANFLAGNLRRDRRKPATARAQAQSSVPRSMMDEVDSDDLAAALPNELPSDLYELLGIEPEADTKTIKRRYHDLQKLCHPDVAGPDGEEMCILLNDAYETLSNEEARENYNAEIVVSSPQKIEKSTKKKAPICTDLGPTWKGARKTLKHHSDYTGIPLSASWYGKVAPEDRGPKWEAQEMLFVDEWACIACRNCCDIAPRSFCIQNDNGRANVYTQWGNSEEYLDYAVAACPVECIYWVNREELQVLEYVTQEEMVEHGDNLPNPMYARQGFGDRGALTDPFALAAAKQGKIAWELRTRAQYSEEGKAEYQAFTSRMQSVYKKLPEGLRARMFPKL